MPQSGNCRHCLCMPNAMFFVISPLVVAVDLRHVLSHRDKNTFCTDFYVVYLQEHDLVGFQAVCNLEESGSWFQFWSLVTPRRWVQLLEPISDQTPILVLTVRASLMIVMRAVLTVRCCLSKWDTGTMCDQEETKWLSLVMANSVFAQVKVR